MKVRLARTGLLGLCLLIAMSRVVQPELLDELGPDDPLARQSRRDLRLINRVMRNEAWLRATLPALVRPGEAVLEIGAGEGTFLKILANKIPACAGLDFWPRPAGLPATLGWQQGDALEFKAWEKYPVIFGNLIFHHFSSEMLAQLGQALRPHVRVFVACEPMRGARFEKTFRWLLCPLIGANRITRHDGVVSIRAGFTGDELARLMGFDEATWACSVRPGGIGAYRFVAIRR